MALLDEKGFVMIQDGKPYWIRMWGGTPWVFYWHPDNNWVSLRQVDQTDIFISYQYRVSEEEAEVYHELAAKSNN